MVMFHVRIILTESWGNYKLAENYNPNTTLSFTHAIVNKYMYKITVKKLRFLIFFCYVTTLKKKKCTSVCPKEKVPGVVGQLVCRRNVLVIK